MKTGQQIIPRVWFITALVAMLSPEPMLRAESGASLGYSVFGTTTYEPVESHFAAIVYNAGDPSTLGPIVAPLLSTTQHDHPFGRVSAQTSARASYGELGVRSEIYSRSDLAGSFAAAEASWTDDLTFTGAGLVGSSPHVFQASLLVRGMAGLLEPGSWAGPLAGPSGAGYLRATYQLDVLTGPFQVPAAQLSGIWTSSDNGAPPLFSGDPLTDVGTVVNVIGFFTPGETLNLTVRLSTGVEAFVGSPTPLEVGWADVDLSHTLTWLGISEVRDLNGNVVTDYSLTSASGTDWIQPVPEPGAFAALVALGCLGWAGWRKCRGRDESRRALQ